MASPYIACVAFHREATALAALLALIPRLGIAAGRASEARSADERPSRAGSENPSDELLRLGTLLGDPAELSSTDPKDLADAPLDLSRATAIAERIGPQPAGSLSNASSKTQLIRAVNATFKGIAPDQIRSMSDSDLAAVSGLIFDQLGERNRAPSDAFPGVAALARTRLQRLLELRKKAPQETLLSAGHSENKSDRPDMIEVYGVPSNVVPISSGGVFRHYTSPESLPSILDSGTLQNGILNYWYVNPGIEIKMYKDLTGIFLTKSANTSRVGVPKRSDFVDVRLPLELPILEIEKEAIYLIPLPARARDWMLDLYNRWRMGQPVDPMYLREVQKMHREGGPGPNLTVPVEIVGQGQHGTSP